MAEVQGRKPEGRGLDQHHPRLEIGTGPKRGNLTKEWPAASTTSMMHSAGSTLSLFDQQGLWLDLVSKAPKIIRID